MSAFAHTPFTLTSSERKTINQSELAHAESTRTTGTLDGQTLVFTGKEIRLVATTGPEDDMLSYRIQGVRNPNLVVPSGAEIRILFINTDHDMRHDIRFGEGVAEFPAVPDVSETVGSAKLSARTENSVFQAEEMVLKAGSNGSYKYFCSVRGHAKGGMWGNILVGVSPGAGLKVAPKTEHIHSADEEKDDHNHAVPHASPTPAAVHPAGHDHAPQKPAEHTDHAAANPAKTPVHDHAAPVAGESHAAHGPTSMSSTVNIGEPMSREGSGTSWVPDSSPMHAYMKMYEDGSMLMLHGTMFFRYTQIGSDRDVSAAGKGGRSRFDAPSMFMAMYSKPIGDRSQIGIRTMFSLDPIIERGYGYPLLYQSGELFHGEPLHDRQHPHDFISELAVTFSHKFNDKNSFYIYAGLPGEPALGPPMYLHRPSGMNNPDAPIGHHWQDASHITFGVVTAGFTHDKFKFEASAFNGTEPDENRWAFDSPKLDSFSGRFSFNPNKDWSFQISHGYLKYPERSEPELKVLRRTTASAIYNKAFDNGNNWSNTAVWGRNHSDDGKSNAFLYESNYEFAKNSVFGRLEQVQKNAHELVLEAPHPEGNFWVGSYSIGYLRDVFKDKGLDVGIGGMATFNTNPAAISGFYGGTKHAGWQMFIRVRPSKSTH